MKKFFVILGFVFLSSSLYAGERPNILGFEFGEVYFCADLEEALYLEYTNLEESEIAAKIYSGQSSGLGGISFRDNKKKDLYYGGMKVAGIYYLSHPVIVFSQEGLNFECGYPSVGAIKVEFEEKESDEENVYEMELISAVRRKYNLKQEYLLINKNGEDRYDSKMVVLVPKDESEAYKFAFIWTASGKAFSMVLFEDFVPRLNENFKELPYGERLEEWLKSLSPHELGKYKVGSDYVIRDYSEFADGFSDFCMQNHQ